MERDDGSGRVEEATIELDRSALSDASSMAAGTAELDRSVFLDAAATALPFPPSSEPGRAPSPNADDGALPFRPTMVQAAPEPARAAPLSQVAPAPAPERVAEPSAPSPASLASASNSPGRLSAPPRPPPPLPPPPLPPLVGPVVATQSASEAAVAAAAPALSALEQLRSLASKLPREGERRTPEPPARVQESAARAEDKDRFRKAFGGAASAAGSLPTTSATSASRDAALLHSPARAASDAAAAASEGRAATSASPLSLERPSNLTRRAVVDLMAFEPNVPARLRRSRAHAPLLSESGARTAKKLDDPAGDPSQEDRARSDVLRILSCGAPLGAEELHAAFDALLDDVHELEVPLFLVEGEVKPTLDEVETLRVAVELTKPLAGANKRVQAALTAASDVLARPSPPLSDAAVALYKQLEAASSELPLAPRQLAEMVERTLREARSFKKRMLLGALRIRAEITLGRGSIPIYLPDSAACQLPLLPTFPLSALVELRPREDAAESHPAALLALALGRVLRSRK